MGDYPDELISEYFEYIENYCERYNSTSGKGYKVGVSVGFYCGIPAEMDKISTFISIADERMYDNKISRKKNRQ